MILNIHQLRSFYQAAKHKSFSKAARELMVTPPAIKMQIKQLEENLGLKLFYRDGHEIGLTQVGRSVFRKAEEIFQGVKEMEDFLEDVSTSRSAELRIGCPQSPAKFILPRLISRFRETYPGIRIFAELGNCSELTKKILNQEVDLAFVRYLPEEKRFKVKVIGTEDIVLLAANESKHLPGNEISIKRLSELPLILPKMGSAMREVIFEHLRRHKVSPNVMMESGSFEFIKEYLFGDHGVAFLEGYSVRDELRQRLLKPIRILEGSPNLKLGIGYYHQKYLSPAAWAFLHLLEEQNDIFATQPGQIVS